MSDLPLVTIVTPSFNQAAFLEQTIQSVLSQDYPNIEYMVIDGGSTDGSVAIIERYAPRLAYWQSRNDRGQADAINQGWRRAKGEILAYLNSDDYYSRTDAVSRVVRAFRQSPEAGLVHGEGHWVDVHGKILQTTSTAMPAQRLIDGLVSLPQPAVFVHRTAVDRVGFLDETLHFALDKEYYLRVAGAFPIVALRDALACLRLHESSKSVATGVGFAPEMLRVAERIIRSRDAYPLVEIDPDVITGAAHQRASQFLYMAGRYGEAWRELRQALACAPRNRPGILFRETSRMFLRAVLTRRWYQRLSDVYRGAAPE
jgi:glycosyltransferase involved in cell wall biosynthesis